MGGASGDAGGGGFNGEFRIDGAGSDVVGGRCSRGEFRMNGGGGGGGDVAGA